MSKLLRYANKLPLQRGLTLLLVRFMDGQTNSDVNLGLPREMFRIKFNFGH